MPLLTIRLLGEFSATDYRGNALSVGNPRTQALVIYLALKIGGKPSLREAAELLFGSKDESLVRGVQRDLEHALRFLPPEIVTEGPDGPRFNRENVIVDAQRFADLISAPSINSIREATDIYRGNLLEGFTTGIK